MNEARERVPGWMKALAIQSSSMAELLNSNLALLDHDKVKYGYKRALTNLYLIQLKTLNEQMPISKNLEYNIISITSEETGEKSKRVTVW